ncbi:MAG: glycogen/starch/alpha-glucan family phosphorylase, partial [Clostridia bacterium]|nr:glycogen/starch/alpha-glucan family phosphorylase [Clostridia bacterium]
MTINKQELSALIERRVRKDFSVSVKDANDRQMYQAVISVVRDILQQKRAETVARADEQNAKQVYYMSMEFLVGRSLRNNLYNLGIENDVKEIVSENGKTLDALYQLEPDAGLGNGGLGRLASCYLDSLTALDYAATGFSIRYEFGIFKQVILDGWQMEFPDNWLEMGGAWLLPRPDEAEEVFFDGEIEEIWSAEGLKTVHKNYDKVRAIPYDLLISGKDTDTVNVLRLWGAKSSSEFDMGSFSRGDYLKSVESAAKAEAISKVLYPADDHPEGKNLRLRQQYFFVSASLKNITRTHFEKYGTLDNLADKAIIHINDTHPSLCVPELMRILMDDYEYQWDQAWDIASHTLAYTNHTVMSEALECWSIDLFSARLPRIYSIIKEINKRFCEDVYNNHPDKRAIIDRLAILSGNMVHMANLCVACCYSVNGVSALHSEILKRDLFKDYNDIFPGKL